MASFSTKLLVCVASAGLLLSGCSDDDDDPTEPEVLEPFSISFQAMAGDEMVGCGDTIEGLGPNGNSSVELSDLRFYVSNIRFMDDDGNMIPVELDENEFQLVSENGDVVLIDLTGTTTGACAGDGLQFPEGTARTNAVLTGMTYPDRVHHVMFDVGMPQSLMRHTILNNTAEDAPSPLREMHWSWAAAYRHFVMNFTLETEGVAGEGYLHIGSRDCGGDGTRALTDRDECGKPYSPTVSLDHFHFGDHNRIGVDVTMALEDLDFLVPESRKSDKQVPGVATHSSTAQPDTEIIFGNFGVDVEDGSSEAGANKVFRAL